MTRNPHIAAEGCAENIALNYLLHEVPEPPRQNPIRRVPGSEKGYVLPFSKERDLVEILSFLAKTKEGPDHIPAVCIEQDSNGAALRALLAINKRTYTDGNDLLQYLKTGFENIFDVLRRSLYERGSSAKIMKQLLKKIVHLCSSRIACRLRLTGKKSKTSIKDILQMATEGARQINSHKLCQFDLEKSLSLFKEKSKSVIQSINEWSNYRVSSSLINVVEKIYQLNNVHRLHQLLHLIPTGPTRMIKQSAFAATLLNIIRKASRYKEAARVLHRIAKKFPLVRNIEIHVATLPEKAFDRPHHPAYSPSLPTVLLRLGKINGKQYNISQISRFVKSDKKKDLSHQFSEKTTRILKEAKIHAEIQLIAYCEIQGVPLFPRAIGSSKDACFLCHAFIQSHGKMHTSRTHGRLYPNWRLPMLLSFKTLEHRFNEVLLNRTRKTIQARDKHQVVTFPYPNESTLLPMFVSASTMSSVQDPVDINKERTTSVPSVSVSPRFVKTTVSTAYLLERKYLLADSEVFRSCVQAPRDQLTDKISPMASSSFFLAGRLHIHFEMEEDLMLESTAKRLVYSIEIMTVEQTTMLPVDSLIVDVAELENEMTYRLPEDGMFCLTAHGTAVKIVCKR